MVATNAIQAQPGTTNPANTGTPVAPLGDNGPMAALFPPGTVVSDPNVKQANCPGCGQGGGDATGGIGAGNPCVPGRKPCSICNDDTPWGKCICGIYDGICCPDPCYESRWIAEANAAFFQDSPRPVTQTRIRWDAGFGLGFPDTSEFFWAQEKVKGPGAAESALRYNSLSLYQEIAAKNFSMFVEVPYLNVDPNINPSAAGLGDMNVGLKTVLLDRELLLVSFQFRTFIPTGNFSAGLGTGHVSLEPSVLAALKITSKTYLQMQLAEWIPVGGTPGFASGVFHYHASLNQSLYKKDDCFNIIATAEVNGFSYRGQFTDLAGNPEGIGGSSYVNVGPGVRVVFCNRCDLGLGMGFGIGNDHGPEQIYRTEFRVRF